MARKRLSGFERRMKRLAKQRIEGSYESGFQHKGRRGEHWNELEVEVFREHTVMLPALHARSRPATGHYGIMDQIAEARPEEYLGRGRVVGMDEMTGILLLESIHIRTSYQARLVDGETVLVYRYRRDKDGKITQKKPDKGREMRNQMQGNGILTRKGGRGATRADSDGMLYTLLPHGAGLLESRTVSNPAGKTTSEVYKGSRKVIGELAGN